jgi:hypothetical protein
LEILIEIDYADVHNTSEMAIGSKLGIAAMKKPPGENFKRPGAIFVRAFCR